jgi:hypothetical protein
MTDQPIISKIWNFANVFRDDGVRYGDYLEPTCILYCVYQQVFYVPITKTPLDLFYKYRKYLRFAVLN